MRIRPVWIAVPACAAAGVVTFSMVAAQDGVPPAGYYPPKTSPHPSVLAEQNAIRPFDDRRQPVATGSGELPPPTVNWAPPPAKLAGGTPPPPPTKQRPTRPVIAGPADPAVVPAGATDPGSKKVFPAGGSARTTPADLPTIPPPTLTPPALTPPAMTPPASTLPPPKVTLEPGVPAAPKPLPTLAPPAAPLPGFQPQPAMTPPAPAAFPTTPLSPKQAQSIALETVAPETIGVGQQLSYELVVKNTGAATVASVRVEEELAAGAKFLGSEPVADAAGGRLAWTLGPIDAGAEKRIRITVKPADEGEIRSRAVATVSAATEARVRVTRPRVTVAVAGAVDARVGDDVPFTIRVSNTGTGPAQKVMLQARMTDGLAHEQGAVIEAELANLPPGETKTLTLRAQAVKPGPQQCAMTVVADGTPAEPARADITVVEPQLVAKLTGPARCLVRAEPQFSLDLTNPGTAATDPVQAWAVVPEGFEFAAATDGGQYTPANRTVVWRLPPLPAGGAKQLGLKLRAASPAEGRVQAVAVAAPAEATGVVPAGGRSGRPLEAKADAVVRSEGVPALRFEVADVDDPVEVGKDAVYEIKVMNQGTAVCTNVQLTATLADGTTAEGASGPTNGRAHGQTVVFDTLPSLAVKGEAVFRVRVRGAVAGDMRFKVQLACDQVRTPVSKEENTRFVKD